MSGLLSGCVTGRVQKRMNEEFVRIVVVKLIVGKVNMYILLVHEATQWGVHTITHTEALQSKSVH